MYTQDVRNDRGMVTWLFMVKILYGRSTGHSTNNSEGRIRPHWLSSEDTYEMLDVSG